MSLHIRMLLVVVVCTAFAWWQVTRALGGNGLSWFYVVEWPCFAGLAIAGWWHLLHEDPAAYAARRRASHVTESLDDPYRTVS